MGKSVAAQIEIAKENGLSPRVQQAVVRGLIALKDNEILYFIHKTKSYRITDPEEVVRAETIAFLVLDRGYDPSMINTEIPGSHNNIADVVLFSDKRCTQPWMVVENKKSTASKSERAEGEQQAFANAVALSATYAMTDYGNDSSLWKIEGYGPLERKRNLVGTRDRIPKNYSQTMDYRFIAGGNDDIHPVEADTLSSAIKRAHAIIWAGGKRDPLVAFDEWSKIMFAKVRDERHTPNGEPRGFQAGIGESDAAIATRVHALYADAKKQDISIFPHDEELELPDSKIASVVRTMQEISFIETDSDIIGRAFEDFFGSVFRGSLGQYFTMRPIARFVVAMLELTGNDYVLDPTCGSGGFLLEALLQVWKVTDRDYCGQPNLTRIKTDFALQNVYGIEIHPVLARICKISLLLHHDGHTNIEADKSCLSPNLTKPLLKNDAKFDIVVGNPPFGTKIEEGDEDQLDGRSLNDFEVCEGRRSVQSEQIILERSIAALKPEGRLGMVLPDGILNNAGAQSNCPNMRRWLFTKGRVLGIVSLPDYAFRRSGATNKTSILIFQKFSDVDSRRLAKELAGGHENDLAGALKAANLDYDIFFAEADFIGYTPSGRPDARNDLYCSDDRGYLSDIQDSSLLGAWRTWRSGGGCKDRRCVVEKASKVWTSHSSHRIDPKYHVYRAHATDYVPSGWASNNLGAVVERRREVIDFSSVPLQQFQVLTISQTGELRPREAGVGINAPEWLGMYFAESSSKWYRVHEGDIVYSGIDLWKGSVGYVTQEFDGALVTQEYPVLHVIDDAVSAKYLALLLRSRRFRRAFRAINTGHSNRRRTQAGDFAQVLIYYPSKLRQEEITTEVEGARQQIARAKDELDVVHAKLDSMLNSDDEWDFIPEDSPTENEDN